MGVFIILFIAFFIYQGLNHKQILDTKEDEVPKTSIPSQRILVQINGEVNKPGVYEMNPEDRLQELIYVAGGFTKYADQTAINLTQKLEDEMVIQIPRKTTIKEEVTSSNKISINKASLEELANGLNGIGIQKAQKIVDYRNEHGKFTSLDELLNIFTESLYKKIKDDITL